MNTILDQKIDSLVQEILPAMKDIRRIIHANPELSGEEVETNSLIRRELAKIGTVQVLPPFIGTDAVALLYGKKGGENKYNVTLRADIDALPMQEESGVEYASKIPGKMHGCGHDGHTACVLGAAFVLSRLTEEFNGSVRFVFQPGEERGALARFLVGKGALENPSPDAVYALHAHSTVPVGTVKTMAGTLMSGITCFKITLEGMSSIRSEPEKAVDAVIATANLITQMNTLISNKVSPLDSAIIDFAKVEAFNPAGDAAGKGILTGHIRYLKNSTGETLRNSISSIVKGLEVSMGVKGTCEFEEEYRTSTNAESCVELLKRITIGKYGEKMFQYMPQPSMGSEDFCYFLEKAPGAFFNLGGGVDKAYCHNPKFDFNDDSLVYGITLMVHLALETLQELEMGKKF
ncbi:MAG: amidohydrolase [Lentisphaeria bacterium]|nr:amidohydrolase [Lentisphaeria bacterium]